MTSLVSSSPSSLPGPLLSSCRRAEALPPWFLLCFAVAFGPHANLASSTVGVLAMLLLGLTLWVSGFGPATQALEIVFAGGWITAWCGTATLLLLTPGLLITDARAWGAALAAVLGVGMLAVAWRRRSRLIGVEPSAGAHPTTGETFWLLLGCAAMIPLLYRLRPSGPDWLVMTTALLLYAALAKRGRVAAQEVAP